MIEVLTIEVFARLDAIGMIDFSDPERVAMKTSFLEYDLRTVLEAHGCDCGRIRINIRTVEVPDED